MLAAAIDPRSWEATLPAGVMATVSLAAGKGDTSVLIDPAGQVTWREHVAPLERQLTLYKNAATAAPVTFSVDRVTVGATAAKPPTVDDFFAAAQFQQLRDSDKLSRPSFEKMPGGVTVTSAVVQTGAGIPATIEYETKLIDSATESRSAPSYPLPLRAQIAHSVGAAAARSALRNGGSRAFAGSSKFTEQDEEFEIVSTDDLGRRHDITRPTGKGAAIDALDAYLHARPAEAGMLQVVPAGETVEV